MMTKQANNSVDYGDDSNSFLAQNNKEGLELLVAAIEKAGYTGKIKIGMDCAASEVGSFGVV